MNFRILLSQDNEKLAKFKSLFISIIKYNNRNQPKSTEINSSAFFNTEINSSDEKGYNLNIEKSIQNLKSLNFEINKYIINILKIFKPY